MKPPFFAVWILKGFCLGYRNNSISHLHRVGKFNKKVGPKTSYNVAGPAHNSISKGLKPQ